MASGVHTYMRARCRTSSSSSVAGHNHMARAETPCCLVWENGDSCMCTTGDMKTIGTWTSHLVPGCVHLVLQSLKQVSRRELDRWMDGCERASEPILGHVAQFIIQVGWLSNPCSNIDYYLCRLPSLPIGSNNTPTSPPLPPPPRRHPPTEE